MSYENIVKVLHGSHLYGLNTENSDTDYKKIFVPTLRDLLLECAPKSVQVSEQNSTRKNTANDVDEVAYSLNEFVHQLVRGEMIALDLIHAPKSAIADAGEYAWIFELLQENRALFYCKDMRSFMGYLKKQAAKYGIKGTRIAALRQVKSSVMTVAVSHNLPLKTVSHILPENEYATKREDGYELMGKLHQWTVSVESFLERVDKALDGYGHRALLAELNEGVDFKAVSHAFRAGYQLISIFEKGDVVFPFVGEEYETLMAIKLGKLDFKTEIEPMLEDLLERVNEASAKSNLPETVDKTKVDALLMKIYARLLEDSMFKEGVTL